MQTLVAFIALTLGNIDIKPSHPERPQFITVSFASGNATFNLSSRGIAQSIDFRLNEKLYSTPLTGCTPLEHIRFDTAMFSLAGDGTEGSFSLTFQMGSEQSRAFGELPMIQISFREGKLVARLITRQTDEHSGFTSPLCPDKRTSSTDM